MWDWIQVDDELLARKLQQEESASLRNKSRKVSRQRPVCDINTLLDVMVLLVFLLVFKRLYS